MGNYLFLVTQKLNPTIVAFLNPKQNNYETQDVRIKKKISLLSI